MSLEDGELQELTSRIGREPTPTEVQIVAAEWSEHCSYKSSKRHLQVLPMDGPLVISEKGYDSGVIDVGGGYVITAHIESHNHPSAVEPYGGAATGVGGVIRDILSTGTRPIAILDGLRFGDISKDPNSRWLFKNAVKGIADYGNCLGIPTIGGEAEFDRCYTGYAMVDVAAVGFGRKERLIKNRAVRGDAVVLIGGHTGRDGIGGSQFASESLESEDRSAVQIPDPFIEKLIIEAILEARDQNLIHAMKDLGGGGLACAISETADSLSVGIKIDVKKVHVREADMTPDEIMISESQERMLVITSSSKLKRLQAICSKYRIKASAIGTVTSGNTVHITRGSKTCARIAAGIVANATLLDCKSVKPAYLEGIEREGQLKPIPDYGKVLLKLLAAPNIASKAAIYGQYDHEVGIRTVVKPGSDSSVLRLDNGRYLSVKIDGNPKHCYISPREGAIGCFEEACRNVVCTGARPIGMLDHLQFGSPKDPKVFWTFLESVRGLADYARYMDIPCVGGKVSLYNETAGGPIKPTPIIGVLGISDNKPPNQKSSEGDHIIMVGDTLDELGGSEYFEYIHGFTGGRCPRVNFAKSKRNIEAVLECINMGIVKKVHDCSKGGLAVAISEICIQDDVGCIIYLRNIPGPALSPDRVLFSESHSRYIIIVQDGNLKSILRLLKKHKTSHREIGIMGSRNIKFAGDDGHHTSITVDKAQRTWSSSLGKMISRG